MQGEIGFHLTEVEERVRDLERLQAITIGRVDYLHEDVSRAIAAIEANTKATGEVHRALLTHMTQEEKDRSKLMWSIALLSLSFTGTLIVAFVTAVPWEKVVS